jgi:hypothetical protein
MKGAFELLENYRARVFNVDLIRDYGMTEKVQSTEEARIDWLGSGAYL